MTPEQKLWQAVLHQAFVDASRVNPSRSDDKRAMREADSWIRSGGRDFRKVCALAGMAPDFLRDAYRSGKVDPKMLRSAQEVAA